jgi:membrane protein implicated in regulation of membrane protease activity
MDTKTLATIWLISGVALVIAEFFAPMFVLIFFGLSAIITGGLIMVGLPQHSGIPYATFAGVSLLLLFSLRRAAKRKFKGLKAEVVNITPGFEDIIGKEAVVASGFADSSHKGRVSFRGTEWDAVSDVSLKPGDRVVISSNEGHKLKVQKL